MKNLKIILISIALLTFSGCYTQLMIEPDEVSSQTQEDTPIIIPPPPPLPIYPPPPIIGDPIIVPSPAPIIGLPKPVTTYPPYEIQRPTGDRRNPPSDFGSNDNSRNTGAQRNQERVTTPQTSGTSSQPNIPTRGNQTSQPPSSQSRRGGR